MRQIPKSLLLFGMSFIFLTLGFVYFLPKSFSFSNEGRTLWWYDNQHRECRQGEFYGLYMYEGLAVFETKEECEDFLNSEEQKLKIRSVLMSFGNALIRNDESLAKEVFVEYDLEENLNYWQSLAPRYKRVLGYIMREGFELPMFIEREQDIVSLKLKINGGYGVMSLEKNDFGDWKIRKW